MAKAPPGFDFYPNDFIAGTAGMSPLAVGCYIRLLCYQWNRGFVPSSITLMKRICLTDTEQQMSDVWANELRDKFEYDAATDHLKNPRLAADRERAIERWEAQRENGKLGGRPRKTPPKKGAPDNTEKPKHNHVVSFGFPPEKPNQNPNHNPNETQPITQTKPKQNPMGRGKGEGGSTNERSDVSTGEPALSPPDGGSLSSLEGHTRSTDGTPKETTTPEAVETKPKPVGDRNKARPKSVEEVAEYARSRNSDIDPEQFFAFYEATNWIRGKTKIKDWRSCFRTWEVRRAAESKSDSKITEAQRRLQERREARERAKRMEAAEASRAAVAGEKRSQGNRTAADYGANVTLKGLDDA